ncbi:5525_t:CDS:2, partial [Dentiscutata heterogama]
MSAIELNCLIHGDTPDITIFFSVELDSETTVNRLKEIIKEKIKETKQYITWVDDNEIVPMDKIIFKEGPLNLEGEIVCTDVGIRIKLVYKSEEFMLDSFAKFIEQVLIKPYVWCKNTMKNLMSDEQLSWSDFRDRRNGYQKLFLVHSTFSKEFQRDEISAINFGLVDGREAIVVTLDQPKGSLLHFYSPSVYEGFPHWTFQKSSKSIYITLGLLVQVKPESAAIAIGSKIPTESKNVTRS